jgi:hypothetical protein
MSTEIRASNQVRPVARRWWPLALVLLLAGCAWHPLYARSGAAPAAGDTTAAMASIAIDPVVTRTTMDPLTGNTKFPYDSRAAQMLHNSLRDVLNPYGPPTAATYRLTIEMTETLTRTASLGNGDATRNDMRLEAKYVLKSEKGKTLLQDRAQIVTSYDVLNQPFSDLQSDNDALQRGTTQLAELIQTRLAVFLK